MDELAMEKIWMSNVDGDNWIKRNIFCQSNKPVEAIETLSTYFHLYSEVIRHDKLEKKTSAPFKAPTTWGRIIFFVCKNNNKNISGNVPLIAHYNFFYLNENGNKTSFTAKEMVLEKELHFPRSHS